MHTLAVPANLHDRQDHGRKQYHQEYLDFTLRYLGDVYEEQDNREELVETWKSRWTLEDLSNSSPRQTNDYDCGLFTLTGITLLSQRIPISPESYSERVFSLRNTRQRIAYLLWKNSRNKPKVPAPRRRRSTQTRLRQNLQSIHKKVHPTPTEPSQFSKMKAQARKEGTKKEVQKSTYSTWGIQTTRQNSYNGSVNVSTTIKYY